MSKEFDEYPTWRNTLNADTINKDIIAFHHISELIEFAFKLNYPYICWNGRLYVVFKERNTIYSKELKIFKEDIL